MCGWAWSGSCIQPALPRFPTPWAVVCLPNGGVVAKGQEELWKGCTASFYATVVVFLAESTLASFPRR